MYEVGKVYIWQNAFKAPYINGKECTVIGELTTFIDPINGDEWEGWETDLIDPIVGDNCIAQKCQLRPKHPPSGEQSIYDQFKRPINTKTPEMA